MPQTETKAIHPGRRAAIKKIATGIAYAPAAGLFSACSGESKAQFRSIDLTGADYAKGFSLADQNGTVRSLKDFSGKVVVLFFGFTQCPDVCPTFMSDMAQVRKSLGADGPRLQVVFVTVDPERDTPGLLQAYMANFDASFVALRPGMDQLPQIAKDYKVYYKKVEGKTPCSYTMEHSAGSYVYDPKGNLRLYSRAGADLQGFTADVAQLLKGA
jgi:protein SCO1